MGARTIAPELKWLYDNNIPVYSISRIDTINHCLYEAYQSYMLHEKGADNIYSIMGTKVHDTLEAITHNKATEADLLPALQSELDDADMFGYDFPKDSKGGDSIRDGWIKDMAHFCQTYKKPDGDFKTEEFFLYKTPGGHWLQGYIDLQRIGIDGSVDIYDYKTSTKYSGTDVIDHGRQLVVYALGLRQKGVKVNSVNWIFLKYAEVDFEGKKTSKSKNKSPMQKIVERRKIGTELAKHVEDDMIELGYDELDRELYLAAFKESNMFSDLPDDVAERYTLKQCVVNYPLDDISIEECINYIDKTIKFWEELGESEFNYPPLKFEREQKNGKVVPDIFYCTKLCGYSKKCKHLAEYLDTYSKEEEEDDLF